MYSDEYIQIQILHEGDAINGHPETISLLRTSEFWPANINGTL